MVSCLSLRLPVPRHVNTPIEEPEAGQKEIFTSWALSILIVLLIVALFTNYILQTRKIQAVHETVLSIFAGMLDQVSPGWMVQSAIS